MKDSALLPIASAMLFAVVAWLFLATNPMQSPHFPSGFPLIKKATTTPMQLILQSSAFMQNGSIPSKYTCDGQRDLNPPLTISGVPEGTKTLALIVDDPDVPKAVKPDGVFDHWILFNIPSTTTEIPEGESAGVVGQNSAGNSAYTGPCPPTQYKPSTHRYVFTLYALDASLSLFGRATKAEVLAAMAGHIIAETVLVGTYHKAG